MSDLKKYGIYTNEGHVHEEIIYSLALIYNVIHSEMTNFFKNYDLTPGKFNILIAIKHHGGDKGLPQVEISKHLIVTKSNMTKLLEKLENDGLVRRESLPGDKRVNITILTKKGTDLINSIWDEYTAKLKSLLNKMDENKQNKLSDLLVKWLHILVE